MESFARISSQVEETDFLSLRLSNAAPTSHDSALIHNIVGTIDNDVTHLDQAIAALELELKKLETNRVALVERRSGYSRLMSPLRSMPLEILGEIFLHASADSLSFRLHASHVCRLWRNAALGCSALWSAIDGRFPANGAQCLWEYVQACVQRSRSRPLTLKTTTGVNEAGIILRATKNCSWKEFSWTEFLRQGFSEHVVQTLASASTCTLQSLTLDTNQNLLMKLDLGTFNRLTSLTISHYDSLTLEIDAPWSQLTRLSLTMSRCDENKLFDIFHRCSNLEECMIDVTGYVFGRTNTSRHRSIHLTKLRKLCLFNDEQLFTVVTNVLVTPVLEELAICYLTEFEVNWDQRHEPCVYSYLRANAQTLRRLWICGLSGIEVENTIVKLNLLEELTLAGNCAMRSKSSCDTFIALSLDDDDGPLPHLRALTVICDVDNSIQEAFIGFVESRWWIGHAAPLCRLRYASLQRKDPDILQDVLSEIERYKEEGLDINMLNASSDDLLPRFWGKS